VDRLVNGLVRTFGRRGPLVERGERGQPRYQAGNDALLGERAWGLEGRGREGAARKKND